MKQDQSLTSSKALKFVLILGIVNLFTDMTYQCARSVNGAHLQMLGASAAVVGFTNCFYSHELGSAREGPRASPNVTRGS